MERIGCVHGFFFAWMSQFYLSEWSLTRALLINFLNTRLLFTKSKSQSQIQLLTFSAQKKLAQHVGLTICDKHYKLLYHVHKKNFLNSNFFQININQYNTIVDKKLTRGKKFELCFTLKARLMTLTFLVKLTLIFQ